jgi:hypothetical protein
MIEVKAEERKKPKFMVRRQNAGQYHDIKAVSKFSEVRKIKKKNICSSVTNRHCIHEERQRRSKTRTGF